jgi:hypothetical protein
VTSLHRAQTWNGAPYLNTSLVISGGLWIATRVVSVVALILGLRARPARNRHVKGKQATLWPELVAHYVVALIGEANGNSAIGRLPRVVTLTLLLVGLGLAIGLG